ncbi:MAG: ATP cone domain-containing protein [Patescibacteria group bacterium]
MNNDNKIYIIKASGDRELFDIKKLENSLKRAQANPKIIFDILRTIQEELRDDMTTAEIYQRAFELLKESEITPAIKYSIRKAVTELGPQGFSFEDFIGAVLRAMGFKVRLRQIIKGLCVSHEIDILANNGEKFIIGEIKFHNKQGIKSDLKVVLYVVERLDDIEKGEFYRNIDKNLKKEKWLITNTKFTTSATEYAECSSKLNLISWNYPDNGNLHQLIIEAGLYPLTILKTLSSHDKKVFLENKIVLCRELAEGGERLFNAVGVSPEKIEKTLAEIKVLLAMSGEGNLKDEAGLLR